MRILMPSERLCALMINMTNEPMDRGVLLGGLVLLIAGIALLINIHPENFKFWAVLLIVFVGSGFLFIDHFNKKSIRKVLSHRESLDDKRIYELYYSSSGIPFETVVELWHEVADALHIPAGKLRPTDSFGKEMGGGFLFTSEALDALSAIAVKRGKRGAKEIDISTIKNLDDYIQALGR